LNTLVVRYRYANEMNFENTFTMNFIFFFIFEDYEVFTAYTVIPSVADPHHFYAAPAPGKNFDPAPAPTLLYSKAKFLKRTKV
jgi:hypothetical protein